MNLSEMRWTGTAHCIVDDLDVYYSGRSDEHEGENQPSQQGERIFMSRKT